MQKKKLVNFRPLLCFVIAMIIAILFACRICVNQTSRLIVILSLISALIVVAYLFYKRRDNVTKILISVFIALIIPFVSVYVKANKISQNHSLNVEKCEIYGKIYKINEKLDNGIVDVYLTEVELIDGERKINFYGNYLLKVNTNNFDISKLANGKYVSCYTKVNLFSLNNSNEFDRSFIARDIMGYSYAYSYSFHLTNTFEPTLRDKITGAVFTQFEKTDLFFTSVGYAMLFGDTSVVEDSVYGVFSLSGTAHLLAVSGFHVSLIVAFLMFVFRKTKFNKIVGIIMTAVILIFYAYLCNFSVSIVRAIIMSMIAMYALLRNKECDRLSILSMAAIFILMLNPLDLFNVSFVLSFVSVLSIILLMPVFERLLTKFLNNKLASSLSLSLSISTGITIYELYYFGKAPVLAFISNIMTVPIVSMLFIGLIISVVIAPIFGLSVPLIEMFGVGMKYVLQFNNWIAKLGLMVVADNVREITLALTMLLVYALSDYLFIKKKNRAIVVGLLAGIIVSLLIF